MSESASSHRPMLNMDIDPHLRQALDAYIDNFNDDSEARVTIRSTTEAALKKHLGDKGFWPFKPAAKAGKAGVR